MGTPSAEAVLAAIDSGEALEWLCRAVETDSVTGREASFAAMVAATLEPCTDAVHTVEVEPGRPLVWSHTRGRGEGPTVLLTAHLDTVAPSGPPPVAGLDPGPFAATVADGKLWGLGSADDKGGIAAVVAALRALRSAGLQPAGDVVTLWVPDEESGEPGTGRSIGMRHAVGLIADGTMPRPDFAVYFEPTNLDFYVAQIGFLIARIVVKGDSCYWARRSQGIDAIRAAHAVETALYALDDRLSARPAHPIVRQSGLVVYEKRGGGNVAVAGESELRLIRNLDPCEDLDTAAAEIETAVAQGLDGTGASADIQFPDGRDHRFGGFPAATDPDSAPLTALRAALEAVAPGRGEISAADYWSEMSFLATAGIDTVYWGPGDILECHTANERIDLADFDIAVKTLAVFLATTEKGGNLC